MGRISITVFGEPKAQQRHKTYRRGSHVGAYDPSKKDKDDFIAQIIHNKPKKPIINKPICLKVCAFFTRPKSHYRTGKYFNQLKSNAPDYHRVRPDCDNILKFIMDAMTDVFWYDDCLIYHCTINKAYSAEPKVVVEMIWKG